MSVITISLSQLIASFPPGKEPRPVQLEALRFAQGQNFNLTAEIPTGEGKTEYGMTILRAFAKAGLGPIFYIVPNKTLLEQVRARFPDDVTVVMGRGEYECLYYTDRREKVNAADSPCYLLKCRHRLNEDGETVEEGAVPCPYFLAKHQAKTSVEQQGIVLTTMAFFIMNRFLVPAWQETEPALVVVDECHQLAEVVRGLFEYRMTHDHLWKVGDILMGLAPEQAEQVYSLAKSIQATTHKRKPDRAELLGPDEVLQLVNTVSEIDVTGIEKELREAIEAKDYDPVADRTTIKAIENITRSIPRLVRNLRYALADGTAAHPRNELNYVVAFRYEGSPDDLESSRATSWIGVRAYAVAGIIRKTLGKRVVQYSATIGNPEIFGHETGMRLPFKSFTSSFEADRTRVYMPNDTPNMAVAKARNGDPKLALRMMTDTTKRFIEAGERVLCVVTSDDERQKLAKRMTEAGLPVLTYGKDVKARDVAARFKAGEGKVLVGTSKQYGQGVDLPAGLARVILFLRPSYGSPEDPMSQFETRRFPESHVWRLRQYRVMLEALQARGRNIRSAEDVGVCIFFSQQFSKFLFNSLPEGLQNSYRGGMKLTACADDALALFQKYDAK
jgi:Rad3-related DNA helicase